MGLFDDDNDDDGNDEQAEFLTPIQPPNKRLRMSINSSLKSCKIHFNESTTALEQASTRKSFATLKNLGSTCYMNCIIQVMRYSPGFCPSIQRLANQIQHLKSLNNDMDNEITSNYDVSFVQNLHELFNEMCDREKFDSQKRPIYTPDKFVNTVWKSLTFWSDGSQQDAHEFLQFVISFVNECDLFLKKIYQQYQLNQIEKKEKQLNSSESPKMARAIRQSFRISASPTKTHTPTKGGASQSLSSSMCQESITKQSSKSKRESYDDLIFRPHITKATRSATKQDKIRNSWIKCEKIELKECYVRIERIDESMLVNGVYKLELSKQLRNTAKSDVRKFKIKSKTFPCIPKAQNSNEDIDEIVNVEASLPLQQKQQQQQQQEQIKAKTKRLTRWRTFSNGKSTDLSCVKSPAELLRKYASIKGHVCEMDKLFKGTCLTITQCLSCETLKKCPEFFYDRSLPVNIQENVDSMGIDWIITHLINESYLQDDSKYMCDTCLCKQEAKIYTQYNEMPNILIIHLLSYGLASSNDGYLNTQKLCNKSKLASFFNCICEHCTHVCKHVFRLYAVVMHSGLSLNSGHYTAYVNCNEENKEWLNFDDSRVKFLSDSEFNRKITESSYDSPYILFYAKEILCKE